MKPKYQVIHSIAEKIIHNGVTYTPSEWLIYKGLSCHSFHHQDGSIENWIDKNRIAFHAGVSALKDKRNFNRFSIGKEITIKGAYDWATFKELIKEPDSFSDDLYQSLAKDCAKDCIDFGMNYKEDIVLHSWISGKDVRPKDPKIDPGRGFDWFRLVSMVKDELYKMKKDGMDKRER